MKAIFSDDVGVGEVDDDDDVLGGAEIGPSCCSCCTAGGVRTST